MKQAIITLCRALGQILNAYWGEYDDETAALVTALVNYVTKYDKS